MKSFNSYIKESLLRDYVYINPTSSDILKILKNEKAYYEDNYYRAIRFGIDNNDNVYAWGASKGLHHNADKIIGAKMVSGFLWENGVDSHIIRVSPDFILDEERKDKWLNKIKDIMENALPIRILKVVDFEDDVVLEF